MPSINSRKKSNQTSEKNEKTVEVLYQRMGDRWFAFSLIDDEVFVGSITQEEINGMPADLQNPHKMPEL